MAEIRYSPGAAAAGNRYGNAARVKIEADKRVGKAWGKGRGNEKRKRKKPGAFLLPASLNSLVGRE